MQAPGIIPKTLKVGGLTYNISIVGPDLLREEAGDIATEKKQIRILESSEDFMFVSLLHEIFHAINMEMTEERVEFLAQAFYQVMADNPIVFTPIKKEEKNGRTKKSSK